MSPTRSLRWLLLATMFAASAVGCASSDPDGSDDATEERAGADPEQRIGPSGDVFELFGSQAVIELRPGETRTVTVEVNSVGTEGGVWTPSVDPVALGEEVTVASALPTSLDLENDRSGSFTIDLTADAAASAGPAGLLTVVFEGPAPSETRRNARGLSPSQVVIVDASVALAPIALSDSVAAPEDGITFDPLVNDQAGDAPLDRASLSIVEPPSGTGTLTVTGDGLLTYVPGSTDGDVARYEICDTNQLCATTQITLWRE